MSGLTISAAALMGLLGGVHCVGMCGGIAGMLCGGSSRKGRAAVATNAGRLTSYALLGAGVGALGGALGDVLPVTEVQTAARVLAAVVLLGVGAYLAGIVKAWGAVERFGGMLLGSLSRYVRASGSDSAMGGFARGLAWGLLPCGLVYGGLALALTTGSAWAGAATMVAFGVGTVPAIGAVIALAGGLSRWMRHQRFRQAAGLLLIVSGAVHLTMALVQTNLLPVPEAERPCCAARHKASDPSP
jgi:hypothetical protein